MERPKGSDCVALRNAIQARLLAEREGMSDDEVRAARAPQAGDPRQPRRPVGAAARPEGRAAAGFFTAECCLPTSPYFAGFQPL